MTVASVGNISNYIEQHKSKIYTYLLVLVVATLFLKKENINSISIILLAVFWILDVGKNIGSVLKDFVKHKLFLFNVIFFLSLIYGLIISENQAYAIKILQRNLPFLIFPLVFLRFKKVDININAIKITLIISALIASIYCEITNLGEWLRFNNSGQYDFSVYDFFTYHWFTYTNLTKGLDLQASFFALYILTSIIFMLEYVLFYKNKKKLLFNLSLFLLVYFILFMFHLSSRIGLVLLIAVLGYYFFKLRIKTKYKAFIFLSATVIFGFILFNSAFIDRLKELKITLQENVVDKGDNKVNSKKIRVYALQAYANQKPIDFLTGRGTGDAQKYLDAFYEKKIVHNIEEVDTKKKWKFKGMHYHNQFVQTNVETGIFGLLALLFILFGSLKKGIKHKSREHVLFVLICIFFFIADSVLMRQKGLVFFTFFNVLFILNYYRNDKTTIQNI